jgi:hypothetical protein
MFDGGFDADVDAPDDDVLSPTRFQFYRTFSFLVTDAPGKQVGVSLSFFFALFRYLLG